MYKSSYTGSQIDEAVAKANEAAPQSTTYTKNEVDSALSGKQATLVVDTNLDSAPTENSTNPVTSGGVYQALSGKANASDLGAAAAKGFDASPTPGNTNNAVSSDGVHQALLQKVGLDVVEHYSLSSSNPVVMDASRTSMFFVFGLAQGHGRFTSMITINVDDAIVWTMFGGSAQPSTISVSYDNTTHKMTIESSNSSESKITVVKCIV